MMSTDTHNLAPAAAPDRYTPKQMLAKLVSFNTVSDQSNLDLISFVESYLAKYGVSSVRVPDAMGTKASLFATIGPQVDGGIVLSAHTDVVPVEGQAWFGDLFSAWEQDGRLYGRGTADMKGFAATVLAKVPDFLAADLRKPIHIALSYDEEVGCFGAPPLIEAMLTDGPRPAAVIVGEPTNMKAVTGHKGIAVLKTVVTGHPVHSSQLHRGVSAISVAARLISWLDEQTAANKAAADPDCPFEPPYSTLHCGTISGGKAHNITAQTCEFTTDIRVLPSEDLDNWISAYRDFAAAVLPDMQAVSPDCAIDIQVLAKVPGLAEEDGGAAEELVRQVTGDNGRHVVVCGPGSIDQAHQPDEFVELSELDRCAEFLDSICGKVSR